MAYRGILVEVDAEPPAVRRCTQAASLARSLAAQLTGMFLRPAFPSSALAFGGAWAPSATLADEMAAFEASARRSTDQAEASFRAAAQAVNVSSDWMVCDEALADQLVHCVRRFDLTVVGVHRMPREGDIHISPANLILAAGGPVVVVPDQAEGPLAIKRIMVAWDGGREAARALHDAWPLIKRADQIAVLLVGPAASEHEAADLRARFARRGRAIDALIQEDIEDAQATAALRAYATAWKADMLVMGFYGHSRLSEVVLGGVSHDFIADPPCTLFVSH